MSTGARTCPILPASQPTGTRAPVDAPTTRITPDTHPMTRILPTFTPTTRADRTLNMLRAARTALTGALRELEHRHPDDPALAARIAQWRITGGVEFRA